MRRISSFPETCGKRFAFLTSAMQSTRLLISNSFEGLMQICSAVQLSGVFLCLLGAARITHRAQGIVSIATRWHMSVASASTRIDQGKSHVPEAGDTLASNAGENESDSSDIFLAIYSQDSYSFQTRQALGG